MLLSELCPYHFPAKSVDNPMRILQTCEFQELYEHCPFIHMNDMRENSDRYMEYLSSKEVSIRKNPELIHYFLTLTRNPKISRSDWFDVACHTLRSKQISLIQCTMEHIDSNIHIHALVTSKNNLSKDKFKAFCNNHKMDIKKVTKDNGINYYLKKENKAFSNLEEFISENKKNI